MKAHGVAEKHQAPAPGAEGGASPAFDKFIATHHPNLSPDEVEAMRARLSNPVRSGEAAAASMFPGTDEAGAAIAAGIRTVGKAFTSEDMDLGRL